MRKMLLGLTLFCFLSLPAFAAGLKSEIVTNKMVYAPGETVYLTIYVSNETDQGARRIKMDKIPALNFHSDAELSGGGTYFRKLTDLPAKDGTNDAGWGIFANETRPYMAYSFRLVDANGKPLPRGYYAISHGPLQFFNAANTVITTNAPAVVIFVDNQHLSGWNRGR